MDTAVQSVDLTKRFGDLTALNKINLEIASGEIFGLLGPNGAHGFAEVLPKVGILAAFAALLFVVGVWKFRFE